MLSVDEVAYATSGRFLLREVSFELRPGELLAIIGPNGAGKSTLLKVLCGDLVPTSGGVVLEGRPLRNWAPLQQARCRAVLPQESSLSFPFTVLEVVIMGRGPHTRGRYDGHDWEIAWAALERTGVAELAKREYPTLSGGEKQRVQFARVLAQIWEPPEAGHRYLFLDEPTSNLDLAHQHHTLNVARRFALEGTAAAAVLHDLNLAAQYADRILLLQRGRVGAVGRPEEVLSVEVLSPAFGLPVVVTCHPCFDCPLVVSALGRDGSDSVATASGAASGC